MPWQEGGQGTRRREWLAAHYPERARYIYGHSLGGTIAIEQASQVDDESGTTLEGRFLSTPEVFASQKLGRQPITPLIPQHFAAVDKVARIGSPLLVVHGSDDPQIVPEPGRKLFEAAGENKRFLPIPGGSHRNTLACALPLFRQVMAEAFNLQ